MECQKCGIKRKIKRSVEIPNNVDHIESNYCPNDKDYQSDYWEEYWIDKNGNIV